MLANCTSPASTTGGWLPISDFNTTDADVSVYFLSQFKIQYMSPVSDPWFSANRRELLENGTPVYLADLPVSVLGCVEQFRMCNPVKGTCTQLSGLQKLQDNIRLESFGLNAAQRMTAYRISISLVDGSSFFSVLSLGENALWANDYVFAGTSSLDGNSLWRREPQSWFQMFLAKVQASTIEFASKAGVPSGSGGDLWDPFNTTAVTNAAELDWAKALQEQCSNQLISTLGQVQNFNFVGVLVIVCLSILIMLMDWSLETIVNAIKSRKRASTGKVARQLDNKFHLLRMALPNAPGDSNGWEEGFMDIPVRPENSTGADRRPVVENGLASYMVGSEITRTSVYDHKRFEQNTGYLQQTPPPQERQNSTGVYQVHAQQSPPMQQQQQFAPGVYQVPQQTTFQPPAYQQGGNAGVPWYQGR
jgi:hypothetical protein